MYKVMIDAGHGGKETGAVANNILEKSLNLNWANALKTELERLGFDVAMTRHQDVDVSLESRVQQANLWKADIFISLHHNAFNGQAKGYEIYHCTNSLNGSKLANCINRYMKDFNTCRYVGPGMYAGAEPNKNYYVNKYTDMPAVLLEPLFIDNKEDVKLYDTHKQAIIVAKGVCDYFDVAYKNNENIQNVSKIKEKITEIKEKIIELEKLL